MKNKGVSPIVAYVLLLIIVISLAVLVFSFLKLYLPSENPQCPEGTTIFIDGASCSIGRSGNPNTLSLNLSNRGLFNISAVFVRIGEEGRTARQQVNRLREFFPVPLSPNSPATEFSYDVPTTIPLSPRTYIVEIQPAAFIDREIVPCSQIATQEVSCE